MVLNDSLLKFAKLAVLAIILSLKLCLRSMCRAKSAWLPSMCRGKSSLLLFMWGENLHTLLRTWIPIHANFARHMEGSHAGFAPHILRRHSFRDQQIAPNSIFAKFWKELVSTTYIKEVNMTYVSVTTFDSKKVLRKSTFKAVLFYLIWF